MSSIRQDIERDRILRQQRRQTRTYHAAGLRAKEVPSGNSLIYCNECKGPVVDSVKAREIHAQDSPKCRRAMEEQNG